MIDKNIRIVDLGPGTWKNLSAVMDIIDPPKRILYLLCGPGNPAGRAVDSENTEIPFPEFHMASAEEDAYRILEEYPQYDEIHAFDQNTLIHYYTSVQQPFRTLDADQYIIALFQQYRRNKGIRIFSRSGDTLCFYEKIRLLVSKMPSDFVFALFLERGGSPFFHVICEFDKSKLVTMTTFDRYPAKAGPSFWKAREQVLQLLRSDFNKPIFYYYFTLEGFRDAMAAILSV